MSETRFSSGPWVSDRGEFNREKDMVCVTSRSAPGRICNLGLDDNPRHIANADLISAAPDMYEAIKEWLEIDGPFVSLEEQRKRWPEVVAKMQAAIQKADGGNT